MINTFSKEVFTYAAIGVFSASLDWIFFLIFTHKFHITPITANLISSHVGISSSFILNYSINFNVKDKFLKRFSSFYLVAFVGYLFSYFFILLGLKKSLLSADSLKALSYIGIFIIQFTLNKYVTFNKAVKI